MACGTLRATPQRYQHCCDLVSLPHSELSCGAPIDASLAQSDMVMHYMDSARQILSSCLGTMGFFSTSSLADMGKRGLLVSLISLSLSSFSGICFLTVYEP